MPVIEQTVNCLVEIFAKPASIHTDRNKIVLRVFKNQNRLQKLFLKFGIVGSSDVFEVLKIVEALLHLRASDFVPNFFLWYNKATTKSLKFPVRSPHRKLEL